MRHYFKRQHVIAKEKFTDDGIATELDLLEGLDAAITADPAKGANSNDFDCICRLKLGSMFGLLSVSPSTCKTFPFTERLSWTGILTGRTSH
ncbi:hypothetical protein [Polynucleobacter necessarius]|uniref:hypothetical protein n=1 Tax=Polynucleobacter necessarius TaxID=576610 RepID=UPI000E097CF5|nr:hypothetical protein [Polynucleobacter necessarius]